MGDGDNDQIPLGLCTSTMGDEAMAKYDAINKTIFIFLTSKQSLNLTDQELKIPTNCFTSKIIKTVQIMYFSWFWSKCAFLCTSMMANFTYWYGGWL